MAILFVILLSLIMNALLAAYELAFVSVPKSKLRQLAKNGDMNASSLLALSSTPERILSVIQLGITAVGAIAAAVGGAGAADVIEPYLINHFTFSASLAEATALVFVVTPLTLFTVIFGELVPKSVALKNPLQVAIRLAPLIIILDKLFSPLVTLLENSTKKVLSLMTKESTSDEIPTTGTLEIDTLSPTHQRLVVNMALLESKKITDIMLPWEDATTVDLNQSLERVAQIIFDSGHTRLPVRSNKTVLGILHTKDFMILRDSGERDWSKLVRSFYRVVETDTPIKVLRGLQEMKSHIGIVYSKDDKVLGLVTLEDILEEIVGEIADEDDDREVRKIFSSRSKSRSFPRRHSR